MSTMTEADPAIVRAFSEQAHLYREAMSILLGHGAGQAAAIVAVQAVRSAASYVFACATGCLTEDLDTVAALWRAVPDLRSLTVLQAGADVLALQDDLVLYAYTLDLDEAVETVHAADTFCRWALATRPAVSSIVSLPAQPMIG